jgi:hypothetical protein
MYVIVYSSRRQHSNFRTLYHGSFWLLKVSCNIISITLLIAVVVINQGPAF